MDEKLEKALAKVEIALRECGLEEKEVKGLINFLKNYLWLKKGEKKRSLR